MREADCGRRGRGALQSDEGSVPTRRHQEENGVKRLREVFARNFERDRASPMKSRPLWVHELVPIKHEGVAKIHLERVERKGTWTMRYEFEDSFVPADLPRAFRQKTKT